MRQVFNYDYNEKVKDLQERTRSHVIEKIVSMAGDEYKKACYILQSHAAYGKAALEKIQKGYFLYQFDEMFDLMAAYFRYSKYPFYPLFKEVIDEDECLAKWWTFVREEVEQFSNMPEFISSLLIHLAYGDTRHPIQVSPEIYEKYIENGIVHEYYQEKVIDYLKEKYALMFDWQKSKEPTIPE